MRTALRIAASLAVSAAFLWFAARGVSWQAVGDALAETRLVHLPAMIAGSILPLYFRATRWRVLVRPLGPVAFRSLFAATAIGFAANMLLPLRAGEVARPWVLSRRERIGFSQAMATIALERLFDMATLLCLFGVATLTLPLPAEWRRYGWFFLAAFLVLLSGLFALRAWPGRVLALVERAASPLPDAIGSRVVHLARGFAGGLAMLGDLRAIAAAMAHSVAVWLSIAVCFGFGLSALGIDVPWVRGALTTTTFVAIAVSIPGGPGFIGMFQAGCVVALEIFGVGKSLAFSYSVLTHLVQFASTVVVGLYFVLREGLHLAELGLGNAGREAVPGK